MNILIGDNYINGTIKNIKDKKYICHIIGDNSEKVFDRIDFKEKRIQIMYFENLIIDRILNHTNKAISSLNKEFVTYDKLIEIMNRLKYTKTDKEYIDLSFKITHLQFQKDHLVTIPIKPYNITRGKKYQPNSDIPKIKLELLENILQEVDKKLDGNYVKYLENRDNKRSENYFIFENQSYVPINKTDGENMDNVIDIPYNIRGKDTNNKITTYIEKYYDNMNNEYQTNILLIFYIRNSKKRLHIINEILNHNIMLKIHKKEKLFKILKKNKDINRKYLPYFIDKIITNGFIRLQDILINNISIKDITKSNNYEYVFKSYQIKNKEYSYIFNEINNESKYMRDILFEDYK